MNELSIKAIKLYNKKASQTNPIYIDTSDHFINFKRKAKIIEINTKQ